MKVSGLSKQQLTSIARILLAEHTDLATDILDRVNSQPEPIETDFSKIPDFYSAFNESLQVNRSSWRVTKTRQEIYFDKLFIAAMVHIYCPEILNKDRSEIYVKKGFSPMVASVTGNYRSNVSNFIRQVIHWEQVYDDFREEVQSVLKNLITI